MSDPVYNKALLRLAADATGAGRLAEPHGTGVAHNPVCGDRVTVDIAVEDGRIVGIALDSRACVLTQASASILGGDANGLTRGEMVSLHNAVSRMLAARDDAPPAPFDQYRVFDAVAGHSSRHRCVLLPIEAVLAAFDAIA
ncbi:MAG TPA: iron-sulfur cluster assembly scaffold protein [Rhizomicrobium sp.]|jgi:nitrogen fixation NifU-like protein|nr:iron-sulfur cluster assembly scaffold protein [Rhizomicrobium sp.]